MVPPFRYEEPLAPDELIDREPELAELTRRAEAGRNTRLTAPRRYGKTSLLGRLVRDVRDAGGAAVLVDLYGVLTPSDVATRIDVAFERQLDGALRRWWAGVRRTLAPSASVGAGPIRVQTAGAPLADPDRVLLERLALPARLRERHGKAVCVVFDEFQSLLAAGSELDALVRSEIQHHRDVAYVFAGSHPGMMRGLFADRTRPLYGQATALELAPLADEDLSRALGATFEQTNRDADPALGWLLDTAEGHPQRSMQLAAHLWEAIPDGGAADEESWITALDRALGEERDGFEVRWNGLPVGGRRVLQALAHGLAPLSADARRLTGTTRGGSPSALRSLVDQGDLVAAAERPGGHRIVDPLFVLWIRSLSAGR